MTRRAALPLPCVLGLVLALLHPASARADEGGVSFWTPGTYASFAAVPLEPGWSLPISFYYYDGSASGSQSFDRGAALNLGLRSQWSTVIVTPTWTPDAKWLGGQPSLALSWGVGWNATSASVSLATQGLGGQTIDRRESVTGGTDLYPLAQIAWTRGVDNWMLYVTGDIPVGTYSSTSLAAIGIGHGAVDVGGAYTYYDEKAGLEGSATLGFTWNAENSSTHYRNGVDSHLDWDVSRALPQGWQLGVAGYVYYQLTGDSGSGDNLGGFKSRVAGVGPELSYEFPVGGATWSANLRGYWEFWARNRTEGYAVYAILSIPLGAQAKK